MRVTYHTKPVGLGQGGGVIVIGVGKGVAGGQAFVKKVYLYGILR